MQRVEGSKENAENQEKETFPAALEMTEVAGANGSRETEDKRREAPAPRNEDASRYCPACSQRLESRRCKLICSVCGYYMSCADYY